MVKYAVIFFGLFFLGSLFLVSCRTTTIISSNKKITAPSSMVIFTFDDGPNQHGETTARLLDVLGKYQVKGVFCILGLNAVKYPELVKRIHSEGHIIVNHGFSDKFSIFMNDDDFKKNLYLADKAITDALGFEIYPKLYRPQGGVYNGRQKKILEGEGYSIVPLTVRVIDVFYTFPRQGKLTDRIVGALKKQDGGIIVLHEGRAAERREKKLKKNPKGSFNRSWIPGAVEELIITLRDNGFILNDSYDLPAILGRVNTAD